jgi:hypothetical protein
VHTLGKAAFCLAGLLVFTGSASANVQAEVEEVRLDAVFESGRRGPLAGGVLSLRVTNRTDADISIQTSPVQVRHGRRLVTSCTLGIVSLGEVGQPLQVTRGAYAIHTRGSDPAFAHGVPLPHARAPKRGQP